MVIAIARSTDKVFFIFFLLIQCVYFRAKSHKNTVENDCIFFRKQKKGDKTAKSLRFLCFVFLSSCKLQKNQNIYMLYSFVAGHAPVNFASKEILSEKHRLEIHFRVIVAAL